MTDGPLERVSSTPPDQYDPGALIEAVNALQPLGDEEALAAVERCAGLSEEIPYGLFWVLRTLFDITSGRAFPPVLLGSADVPPPPRAERLPRFPIVLVEDVPLLTVRGYALGGLPEPVQVHIEFFRSEGQLRAAPLSPRSSGAEVEDAFTSAWRDAYGEPPPGPVTVLVREQLARMQG